MGMYDTYYAECPKCGEDVEFQSKAGACDFYTYRKETIHEDPAIAADLSHKSEDCKCGATMTLHAQIIVVMQESAS
jgi:hypothetical protein